MRRDYERDDPRERYGNEEDPWSREYRRAYAEGDLPRRLHDDRPYDRPGYEPEFGRPGGRENVDMGRDLREGDDRPYGARHAGDPYGFDWEQPAGQRGGFPGYGRRDDSWQGGYYGQGRRFGGEPFGRQGNWGPEHHRDSGRSVRRFGQAGRNERYGQPSYGRAASPYDEGEIGSWYGGDTGMGDAGSGWYGGPSGGQIQDPYGDPPGSQFWRQYGEQLGGHESREYGRGDRFGTSGGQPRGRFSGRGPRDYRRSDERIREDVCELLTRHGEIDASEMEVEIREATVILRGMADSGRTRRLAEELVEDVPGVRDVQNELRVHQRTGYRGDFALSPSRTGGDGGEDSADAKRPGGE
jgi:BON domain